LLQRSDPRPSVRYAKASHSRGAHPLWTSSRRLAGTMNAIEIFLQLADVLSSLPGGISVLRFALLLILTIVLGISCCCTSVSPPAVSAPPLPLAYRVAFPEICKHPEEGSCIEYEDVPWSEWKNPRLILTSEGIKVLLPSSPDSIIVPPRRVGDVLEKTTRSDWPLGLIVMAKYGFADHQMGDRRQVERNRVELLNTLNDRGIRLVWGPPPA
jgi:hypothetical protein